MTEKPNKEANYQLEEEYWFDLTGEILVFWKSGRLWEVVVYKRWSHTWRFYCIQKIEVHIIKLDFENLFRGKLLILTQYNVKSTKPAQ